MLFAYVKSKNLRIFQNTAVWTDRAFVHSALMVDLLSFLHCVTAGSWAVEATREVVHLLGERLLTLGEQGLCLSHLCILTVRLRMEQVLKKHK